MVMVLKNNEGGTHIISANLHKTIQSIREIVGKFSDSEIYNSLKDCNMDPNETAQKLLHQDPFHEVRRRRDKKKEDAVDNDSIEPRKRTILMGHGTKSFGPYRGARRGGYTRNNGYDARPSWEFRVVKDNRINRSSERETKDSNHVSLSTNIQRSNNSEKSGSLTSNNQRHFVGRYVKSPNRVAENQPKPVRDIILNARKGHPDERKLASAGSNPQIFMVKAGASNSQSGSSATSNAVGVYASASDPVHVPSPDSKSPAAIGAIRREVGVVGRRPSAENISKQSISNLNSVTGNSVFGNSSTSESLRPLNSGSQSGQNHASVVESVVINPTGSRFGGHFGGRVHQQPVGHHKGPLSSKEWKPKTSQTSVASPGVIGSPVKSVSKPTDISETAEKEVNQLEEKLSQVNIHESQNVIIAEHIRVPESDRCRLNFGSFDLESDVSENAACAFQAREGVEEEAVSEPSPSKQLNPDDDQVQKSGSSSPLGAASEIQLSDKQESSVLPDAENYANMGLVHNAQSFTDSKLQQHQDNTELPNFSTYNSQPAYDIPYFRPPVDDAVLGSGLPSPQEVPSSHTSSSIPTSSIATIQQQIPMPQMYPQVHVQHFPNVMPYRQFIPPMYVPSMVPGYSGNPGYPHLSNGNSYVLMPGGSSHLPANNLKYGVHQFKPLPAGSRTGFGNFANASGFALNAPGVVGGPTSLDEASRLKYKDGSLYVPNPQAETSEIWIQNHRELVGMQSTPYFNMQGQPAHPAYLQSHSGHASYNAAAVAQSSHIQYPGMYPPQAAAAIPSVHHLGAGNIGVGVAAAAPGAQVGAYQQPQMSHLNWTTNF